MAITKAEQRSRLQRNEEKWSPCLMEAGWTVLPSIILEKQHALGLDAIDVNILLQLARHWWYRDNPPHPSKASIAECLGVDPSTVRRHIAPMEAAGLIRREARYKKSSGQENNAYHFDGLIKEATPFAEEAIKERERQKSERVARQHRKRPRLVVNNQPTDSGRPSSGVTAGSHVATRTHLRPSVTVPNCQLGQAAGSRTLPSIANGASRGSRCSPTTGVASPTSRSTRSWSPDPTRLAGAKIRFLPFNRGRLGDAGNPPIPPTRAGYATDDLWEETWARDSILDLIASHQNAMSPTTDSAVPNISLGVTSAGF